jgi:hypothetical protein
MPTISELMEGKAPGTVKIRMSSMPDGYFVPYYLATRRNYLEGYWHGLTDVGLSDCHNDVDERWYLYTEPKQKVVWVEWLVTSKPNTLDMSAYISFWPSGYTPESSMRNYTPTGRTVEVEG